MTYAVSFGVEDDAIAKAKSSAFAPDGNGMRVL